MSNDIPDWFVRVTKANKALGCSRSTMYNLINAGLFLKPVKISSGMTVIKKSELMAYIDGIQNCDGDKVKIRNLVSKIMEARNESPQNI